MSEFRRKPMNNKRCFLLVLALLLAVYPMTACQKEPEISTIAIINSLGQIGVATVEGFKTGMTKLGYVEGETIVYDVHTFNPDEAEEIAAVVQSAADQPVDLIVALGVPAAVSAKQASAENKIRVLFNVADPVGAGLIDNLRQPGDNMTGTSTGSVTSESEGRRLEWLQRIKPDLERIHVIHNPEDTAMIRAFEVVQATAVELGIEVVVYALTSQAEVDALMTNFPQDVKVFFPLPDRRLVHHVPTLIELSLERKFILSTPVLDITRAGGLMAFAPDFGEIGKQMARQADQVLKGADPGSLPVEEPEILLNVNLKTAEAIGIEIPDEVLEASYEIIR